MQSAIGQISNEPSGHDSCVLAHAAKVPDTEVAAMASSLFDVPPEERVALVTGAASGIGAATAVRLVAEGVTRLVLVDRDRDGLQRLARDQGLATGDLLRLAHDVAEPQA